LPAERGVRGGVRGDAVLPGGGDQPAHRLARQHDLRGPGRAQLRAAPAAGARRGDPADHDVVPADRRGAEGPQPRPGEGVMARTLTRRLGYGLIAVLGVAVLAFLAEFVIPGDPARALAPRAQSAAVLENIRAQLHLNQPVLVQFADYFANLFRGNLGT